MGPSNCTNLGVLVCPPRPCMWTGTSCWFGALVEDGMTDKIVGSSMGQALRAADEERVGILFGRVVETLVGGAV